MNKPKIKISYDAYYRFMDAMDSREEFNCLKFETSSKGCGAGIDIYLAKEDPSAFTESIDELPLVYSEDVAKSYLEIIIVYRDDSFKVKTKGVNDDLSGLLTIPKKKCGGCKHKSGEEN